MRRVIFGAIAVVAVAMIAVHVPLLFGSGRCPFGFDRVGAATRHDPLLRGTAIAADRPALGFALDATSRGEITRWAMLHGAACGEQRGTLECDHVAQPGTLALTTAWFRFNASGMLDSIRAVRRTGDPNAVASAFAATNSDVARGAGPQFASGGRIGELSGGVLRQAFAEYRFTNYRAVVRATNMGDGYVLTEEYAAL